MHCSVCTSSRFVPSRTRRYHSCPLRRFPSPIKRPASATGPIPPITAKHLHGAAAFTFIAAAGRRIGCSGCVVGATWVRTARGSRHPPCDATAATAATTRNITAAVASQPYPLAHAGRMRRQSERGHTGARVWRRGLRGGGCGRAERSGAAAAAATAHRHNDRLSRSRTARGPTPAAAAAADGVAGGVWWVGAGRASGPVL